MNEHEYLTTGEAAALLGISRSTVSRLFDSGGLQGRVNPLTSQRLILRSSVQAMLTAHGLPATKLPTAPGTLLATSHADLATLVNAQLELLGLARAHHVHNGAETLLLCARQPPQLLVLDASLPNLAAHELVVALHHRPDPAPFPIIAIGLTDAQTAALPPGAAICLPASPRLTPDWLRQTIAEALGIRSTRQMPVRTTHYEHHRSCPRIPVTLRARVSVYSARRPRQSATGSGLVRNISQGGALIEKLRLETSDVMSRPFRLLLEVEDTALSGWKSYCRVVRLASNGDLSAGLAFLRTPRRDQQRLAAFLQPAATTA